MTLLSACAVCFCIVSLDKAYAQNASSNQADPNATVIAETERINAETGRINAETARINARAQRSRARIESLNLPSFDGDTTVNSGAGAAETTLLAMLALEEAADEFASIIDDSNTAHRPVLLLTGQEQPRFALMVAVFSRIAAVRADLDSAIERATGAGLSSAPNTDDAGVIAAVSAVAGLLRSDVEISEVKIDTINDRLLRGAVARATANREREVRCPPPAGSGPQVVCAPGPAYRVFAAGNLTAPCWIFPDYAEMRGTSCNQPQMITSFDTLVRTAARARDLQSQLRGNQSGTRKAAKDALDAALEAYDEAFEELTEAQDDGTVPLVEAASLEQLLEHNPMFVRLTAERAAGSIVERSDITTFFGGDPIRVSSSVIASMDYFDPRTGQILDHRIVHCRTAQTSIRRVQNNTWGGADGRCDDY
ncbi:MAG: hypothetical protein AAFW97_00740 [Pseudomonadota bacterium]